MHLRARLYLFPLWILVAVLLGHLAVPVCLDLGIYKAKRAQELRMASPAKESPLALLVLTRDSFDRNFNAAEGELELNGLRYDVKDYTLSGNMVTCHAMRDDPETKLAQSLSRYSEPKEKGDVKFRLWFPHFFESFRQYQPVTFGPMFRTAHLSQNALFLPAAPRNVLSPPPERA